MPQLGLRGSLQELMLNIHRTLALDIHITLILENTSHYNVPYREEISGSREEAISHAV